MSKKTIDDFKRQAKVKNITRWIIHHCSMCNYPCGYSICNEHVRYDSGCSCSRSPTRQSSWEELAKHYNNNAGSDDAEERFKKNPLFGEVIEEMNNFWGFKNPEFLTKPK